MSELHLKVKADQLQARKDKATNTVPLLSTLLGQLQKVAKNKAVDFLDNNDVIAEIRIFLNGNAEMQNNASGELLDLAKHEEIVLRSYLPKQLSADELTKIFVDLKTEGHNFATSMKHLKDNFTGSYDGKLAAGIAKSLL